MFNQVPLLAQLPTEMLENICECLLRIESNGTISKSALANLRLTSRRLRDVGVKSIVKTTYFRFNHRSFQNFMRIAQDPVLSTLVQHIHYDSPALTRLTRSGFEDTVRQESILQMHTLSSASGTHFQSSQIEHDLKTIMRKYWSRYQDMQTEQVYMQKHNLLQHVLATALPRLTSLQGITVSTQQWNLAASHPFIEQTGHIPAMNWESFTDGDEDDTNSEHLFSLIALSVAHHPRFNNLTMSTIPWRSFLPAPAGLNIFVPMFTSLRSLKLVFDDWLIMDDKIEDSPKIQQSFQNTLSTAKTLECLNLRVRYGYRTQEEFGGEHDYHMIVLLETILAPITFANLKVLALTQITASTRAMKSFLEKHSSTLRHLTIDSWQIFDETIHSLLKLYVCLRESLNLDNVRLRGIWILRALAALEGLLANMESPNARKLESWILKPSNISLSEVAPVLENFHLDQNDW